MSSRHPVNVLFRRHDLLALACLLALVLLFFWKLALTNLIIARGDIFYYFYPYRDFAAASVRAGHIPLWNPYLFMGAPFLANSQVGFFYPLNLLTSWLDVTRAINWTIVLHIFIAAAGVYVLARSRLGLSTLAAWLAAVSFGLGGYLGTQIEHVNQLQGLAWIGWIFLAYDRAMGRGRTLKSVLLLAVVVSLQLLAGHTQSVFITLFGLGIYAIWPVLETIRSQPRRIIPRLWTGLWLITFASVYAVALSAIQLLPTLELARLSARSGGLPTNLAVSFSLDPRLLGRALLPDYAGALPAGGEFTAFFGIAALMLMLIGASSIWPRRNPISNFQLPASSLQPPTSNLHSVSVVALAGLVLAFGGYEPLYYALLKIVPGFDLFRAPARWIVLFVFGGSLLAGVGLDAVRNHRATRKSLVLPVLGLLSLIGLTFVAAGITPPGASGPLGAPDVTSLLLWIGAGIVVLALIWYDASRSTYYSSRFTFHTSLLVLLACLELFLATRALTYNSRATAPDALISLRPAMTQLLADAQNRMPPDRFLSISNIQFDPGDSAELKSIFENQLSSDAFYDLIVATKAKEILAPNLPLYYRLPAVDGYDGGVLPLRNYLAFQRLFLDPSLIQTDGRLREQLPSVPAARWLDLMNARHIITDKVGDNWYDGVLYDLQFTTPLSAGQSATTDQVPAMPADALGILYTSPGGQGVLANVDVTFTDGAPQSMELRPCRTVSATQDLVPCNLTWGQRRQVQSIRVTGVAGLTVRGVALLDQAHGAFQSFALASQGRFKLAHSGDVKVYENVDALPRAFVVPRAQYASDDDTAIALMQSPDFVPSQTVVLVEVQGSGIGDQVTPSEHLVTLSPSHLVSYAPEQVVIDVDAAQPGYLVLTDAYYPGWVATVDGQPAEIERADVLFRAVKVPAGQHRVEFRYEPRSFSIGAVISIAAWLTLVGLGLRRRHRPVI